MDDVARDSLRKLEELEQKVRRAVTELKNARAQRDAARAEAETLRAGLREHAEKLRRLEAQLSQLTSERDHVRARIQQLATQIDSLGPDEP